MGLFSFLRRRRQKLAEQAVQQQQAAPAEPQPEIERHPAANAE